MALFAAVFADPIDLKRVPGGEVVIPAADFLFELADFLGKKLNGTATTGANHVVMTAAVVLVLVTGNAVVEGDFAGQATLRQQFQRAVDGGIADAGVLLLHQAVEFIGGKMVAGFEERMQNDVALGGLLEAHALQMLVKDVLGFADHLAGDGGLIINAV